ncbi:ABC transporter permease/M1 family aminopeptidase [Algoriphagus chordae]|uniref:Peptidase M1-like protein n=1 Tax=Algoriphagus chordae TaxID=237019 RepID=A0A2W7RHD6_9BACT|nr:M1 family aminopeptidase [Algoriphagus chordae]PZX54977.1 peptidase M1-like protein [Algoriphagus chordae]
MFSLLLKFEAYYQLKQRAFPLLAVLFLFLGYFSGSNSFAPANVSFNSAYQIQSFVGLFSLASVFIIMFFVISGILRDAHYKMDALIYSTSVEKTQFFWSRFLGVFAFSVLAFTAFIIGMLLAHSIAPLDPERIASFRYASYLNPWLTVVLPNIFICSSIIFSVAILSNSNVATYVSAVVIYMFYMICAIFLNSPLMAQSVPASPEAMAIAALADPFGISAFFEQTQFWTAFEKNSHLLSFSGLYMWNRLLWLGIAILILLVSYRIFSFRKLNQKVEKVKVYPKDKIEPIAYKTFNPSFDLKSDLAALFSFLKIELNGLIKSLPFIAIMLIWLVLSISEIYSRIFHGGDYSDSLYPLTNLIIINIIDPLKLLGVILIIFYSGELVWRERSLNFNGIIDATPIKNWVLFVSKLMALLLLPAILIGSGIIIGLGFQIASGFFEIDLGRYLAMFYFNGLQLFLFSVLAVFIQSLVKNRYLGMGITGIIIIASFLSPYIGIEHSLLRFGNLPHVDFSPMTGYSKETLKFLHLAIFWIGLAGIMAMISFKLWQRGIGQSLPFQFNSLKKNWKNWERIGLALSLSIFLAAGLTFLYNTHLVNEYFTSDDMLDYREEYERKFKQYESLPQLYSTDIKTTVDLYPEENRYHIKANYLVINREDYPVSRLFISGRIPLKEISLEGAELIEYYPEFDSYLFEFNQPVKPQQEVDFNFEIDYEDSGYEFNQEIIENGTYLSHRSFEPFLGYRASLEISDNFERGERNLPFREEEKVTDSHLEMDDIKVGRVNYETVISTTENEIALSSGNLIKEWKQDGRNYFHFKSDQKILPTIAYFSSSYQIKKQDFKGLSIEQYYFPAHSYNIDSIASSIVATLDYCEKNFGAYPFNQIRIAEIPSHWNFGGFAHPGVISMVEDRLYLTDIRNPDDFNLVAKRTIHEVAHQWWGHILAPKVVEGASIFIEGLAKYTEAVVMEKLYGKKAIYQLSENANRTYFTGRAWATEPESPIYLVSGQGFISYGKNYTVMLALRDLIGEDRLNQALRNITDRFRNDVEFSATSSDFLEEIYRLTPSKFHDLIDDWFRRVITYDLAVANVSHRELDNGKFEIKMTLKAKRFETQANGEANQININEPIQIGVFDRHPSEIGKDAGIIYLEADQIFMDGQELKILVDRLPKFVSIDPFGTRSDENMSNNTVRVN